MIQDLAALWLEPDQPIAWRDQESMTAKQWLADIAVNVDRLKATGYQRAALICDDSYWFSVGLFALLSAGIRVVLPHNALPATLGALASEFDGVVSNQPLDFVLTQGCQPRPFTLDVDACFLDFFTSGSTGTPKKITHSLAQLQGEVLALHRLWGEESVGRQVQATVPHHHMYGLIFKLLWPLASGRAFSARTCALWEDVIDDQPNGTTVLISSPAHLNRLGGLKLQRPPSQVFSAGAPLPFATAQEIKTLWGILPTEIFGSTETGAIATRKQEHENTPWVALPGNAIIPSEEGALSLLSPYVDPHHWVTLEDRIERVEPDGFSLKGRLDRVVKIEGKRVSLDQIENTLKSLTLIADAAVVVIGEDSPQLAAVVVLKPESQPQGSFRLGREIRHQLSPLLEPACLPKRWRFVESIPLGPMGKRQAHLLEVLFKEPQKIPQILNTHSLPNGIALDLLIDQELAWFEGHFPQMAILPGVVQIHWAVLFANQSLGLPLAPAQQLSVKFKAIIVPHDAITLKLEHETSKNRLKFTYLRGAQICSSGYITLAAP